MNFRPTLLKIILSLVLGFIIGLIYSALFRAFDYSMPGINPWIMWKDILIESIIPIVMAYIIWSFVENNKK